MKQNKKIDVIVEARMSSTRLPGKVLMKAVGKPMLELMVERLKMIPEITDLIIATTVNDKDGIENSRRQSRSYLSPEKICSETNIYKYKDGFSKSYYAALYNALRKKKRLSPYL